MGIPQRRTSEREYTLTRRRFLAYTALASLAAACQQSSTPGASPTAKVGGTLVVASGSEPGLLENSININSDQVRQNLDIYDRLILEDLSADAPLAPLVPGLATSWTASPDGLQYTFKLRQGVTFHDGTPVDAAAIKFNVDRVTQPSFEYYYARGAGSSRIVFGRVASTDVVDQYTARINLREPYGNFLDAITNTVASIASPANVKKYGTENQGEHPSGSGPFKFGLREPGQKLVLERNPQYWGGVPALDQVIVRPIAEPLVAVSALRTGEVQLITSAPPDLVPELKNDPNLSVSIARIPDQNPVMFNMREKPITDKRVRQALNWAIDRQTLTRDLLKGLGEPAKSLFGPSAAAYDQSLKGYTYDLDKARALLKDAGLENGFAMTLQCIQGGGQTVALFIKDSLAKLKIDVKVEALEGATLGASLNREGIKPGVAGVVWGWSVNPPYNFDRFFTSSFAPPNGVNFGFYANSEVDKFIQEAARTPDRDARVKIYRAADALVTEDAAWLFMYHTLQPRVTVKNLKWVSANAYWYTLRNAQFR